MKTFDDELRSRFAELREHERKRTPAFDGLQLRTPRRMRGGRGWWIAGGGLGLAAAATVVILLAGRRHQPEMSITEWRAPTDVLLQVSGTQWLRELPTLQYQGIP